MTLFPGGFSMSESFWKTDVMEEAAPEKHEAEPAAEAVEEAVAEAPAEPITEAVAEPALDASTVTLSVDEFSALEERVMRTVNLVKWERQARATAEERASKAELELREQAPLAEKLQKEINALREERNQVRERVERILSQLDALEL
jgi:predicted phage tail protein